MKKSYFFTLLTMLMMTVVNAQIVQVTDINKTADAGIANPTVYNGEVYFEADDGTAISDELYKIAADGTVSLVKDINVDPDDSSPTSDPQNFIEYNGKLYFNANDGDVTGHDKELWVTDGTEAGTMLVADIWPGLTNGSNPMKMCVFNGKLYFQAKYETGTQIWRYDGANAPVKLTSVKSDGYATPDLPTVDEANGKVYWKINNGTAELGVLHTDESFEVIDINTGTGAGDHGFAGSEAGILLGGKMFFQGDNGTDGDELWSTDGTIAGTVMVKDINTAGNSDPESFVEYNSKVVFVADGGTGLQLWETDGTEAGTKMIAEPFSGGDGDLDNLKVYNGKVYFSATDGVNGNELWVYDGVSAAMLKDINTKIGDGNSNPEGFTEVDGLLFFEADDSTGTRLWLTNGTMEGTVMVSSLFETTETPTNVNSGEFAVVGSVLYFSADDANGFDDIYAVDVKSIKKGINQATDINKTADAGIANPTVYNGEVYFEADDGTAISDELYKIAADGTVSLVKDINVDPDDSSPTSDPQNFIEYNGKLYFNANDGDVTGHDKELWVTDGTEAGTMLVADIWPGLTNGSNPMKMCVFNGKLYFQAKYETGTQIWRYDGANAPVKLTSVKSDGYATPDLPTVDEANGKVYWKINNGTAELGVLHTDESFEVIDINTGTGAGDHGFAGSEAGILLGGKMFFQGDNGTDGDELWSTDGTIAGTVMVKDINTAGNSDPESFVEYNSKVVFVADGGTGLQLWETDGTEAGTKMIAEPFSGGDGDLDNLKVYNGKVYFSATDGVNGNELWVYDGVSAAMLKDINTKIGDGNSNPEGFSEVDGLLFFEADDSTGTKLWVTDGSPEHTMRVASALNSTNDPVNVNSGEFASVGSILYFTADDANGYDDIYSVDAKYLFPNNVTFTVSDANGVVENASVEFDGATYTTDANGMVTFEFVRNGADLTYKVTKDAYIETTGTLTVDNADVSEDVVIVLIPLYSVTFTVTDGTNALNTAAVTFNGSTVNTDASGVAVFSDLEAATGLSYTVSLAGYDDATGSIDIVDADVNEPVALTLITYSVTFNVSEASGAIADASITFNGSTMTSDASGVAVFTDVAPATGMPYTVTLTTYLEETGTVDVDGDEVVNVTLLPTAIFNHAIKGVNVYPNPSNGEINISGLVVGSMYEVYSVNQSLVKSGVMETTSMKLNLEQGLYILKVKSEGETYYSKIVIK